MRLRSDSGYVFEVPDETGKVLLDAKDSVYEKVAAGTPLGHSAVEVEATPKAAAQPKRRKPR